MPKLQPTDVSFLTSAPKRFSETFQIARPAEQVWAELIGDDPLGWCRGLSITWTSSRPFGVGTTRDAKVLGGAITVHEKFIVWEEGHRKTFVVEQANLPLFNRLAEDYVVEGDGPDRCRFTWTVAIEPSALGTPGGPVNAALFKSFFADTRKHFGAA